MAKQAINIPTFEQFQTAAQTGAVVPIYRTLLGDHLTPVTAYERLAANSAYSFLLESVVGGERIARYSFLGANPRRVIKASDHRVVIEDRTAGDPPVRREFESADPLRDLEELLKPIKGTVIPGLPHFLGGAVGFAGYDTVRYLEPEKLAQAPTDTRGLPDLVFGIYDELVIFDHVQKTIIVVANAHIDRRPYKQIYDEAAARIDAIITALQQPMPLKLGVIDLATEVRPQYKSNFTKDGFENAVLAAKEYIKAGDIFQVVLSQRLKPRPKPGPLIFIVRCAS